MKHEPSDLPKLYGELAEWWPVLSAPEVYREEAGFYRQAILSTSESGVRTLLELGSGGGNNASHLKWDFDITLVDLSPGMLAVSRQLNPECEHVQGDMRTVRLDRQFDAVFIHDAITYMASEEDLRRALATAHIHCRPGGVALFAPDHTRETYRPATSHGGHDRGARSMRYLEWSWDPDPKDTSYLSFMVYVLRLGDQPIRVLEDLHICGLFAESDWLQFMGETGFQPRVVPFDGGEQDYSAAPVFLGVRPTEQRA